MSVIAGGSSGSLWAWDSDDDNVADRMLTLVNEAGLVDAWTPDSGVKLTTRLGHEVAQIDVGINMVNDGVTNGSNTLTSAGAPFESSMVGLAIVISGHGRRVVTSYTSATSIEFSGGAIAADTGLTVKLPVGIAAFADGVTDGTNTLTSAAAPFNASHVGTNVSINDVGVREIVSFTSASSVELDGAVVSAAEGRVFTLLTDIEPGDVGLETAGGQVIDSHRHPALAASSVMRWNVGERRPRGEPRDVGNYNGGSDVGGFAQTLFVPANNTIQLDPDGDDIQVIVPASRRWICWMNYDADGVLLASPRAEETTGENIAYARVTRNSAGDLYTSCGTLQTAGSTTVNFRASDGSLLIADVTPYEQPLMKRVAANGDSILNNFDIDYIESQRNGDSRLFPHVLGPSRLMRYIPAIDELLVGAWVDYGNDITLPHPGVSYDGVDAGPVGPGGMSAGQAGFANFSTFARYGADDAPIAAQVISWVSATNSNYGIRLGAQDANELYLASSGGTNGQTAASIKGEWGSDAASPLAGAVTPISTSAVQGWVALFDRADLEPRWVLESEAVTGSSSNEVDHVHTSADDHVYAALPGLPAGTIDWDRSPSALSSPISVGTNRSTLVKLDEDGDLIWQKEWLRPAFGGTKAFLPAGMASNATHLFTLVFTPNNNFSTSLDFGNGFTFSQNDSRKDAAYLVKTDVTNGDTIDVRQLVMTQISNGDVVGFTGVLKGLSMYPSSGNLRLGVVTDAWITNRQMDFGNGQVQEFASGDLGAQWFSAEFDTDLVCQGFVRTAESTAVWNLYPYGNNIFGN